MTSVEQCPLLSTYTDSKVDPKVDLDQPPPGYQTASEAPLPPPADPEPDQSGCRRHRRRWGRFGHFAISLLFLWHTARYIMHHCELRRFAHPYADEFPLVGLSQYVVELN